MELEDWTLAGYGMEGESYFHKTDPDVILKLYAEHVDKKIVEEEFNFNKELRKIGLPCPEAYKMTSFGNRQGIIFQRIHNKMSFCTASGKHPEQLDDLARRFALMTKKLHSISAEGTHFPSCLESYRELLTQVTLKPEIREKAQKAFDEVAKEDCKFLIHGDFHYGNAVTDGTNDYFIDLGSLSYGNPKFDIAMFFLVSHYGSEKVIDTNFHLTVELAMKFWNAFKKYYFEREISDEELLKTLKNYLLLRAVWMIRITNGAPFVERFLTMFTSDNCPCEDRTF